MFLKRTDFTCFDKKKLLKYNRSMKISDELIRYQERRKQSFDQFGILETNRLFGGQMEVS